MFISNRGFRLSVCGMVLGAFFLGLAGSAMAWDEPLWVRQLGTADHDWATGVADGGGGNVFVAGLTGGSLGGPNQGYTDAWVAQYSAAGGVALEAAARNGGP